MEIELLGPKQMVEAVFLVFPLNFHCVAVHDLDQPTVKIIIYGDSHVIIQFFNSVFQISNLLVGCP